MARIAALLVLVALVATPSAALAAAQSPLQDTVPQEAPVPAPVQQDPAPQTDLDGGSLGTGELLLIALGIAALIGGIWLVIARDARRATAGRVRSGSGEPAAARGGGVTRAARRGRRLSADERRRRKRGRAR